MSLVSGKCDFLDHLSMQVLHDCGTHQESDLLECFESFKEKTGGVIYQHIHIKEVNEFNRDLIAKKCPCFKIIPVDVEIADARTKSGIRTERHYSYEYYGKIYSAKELKKHGGVYIEKEIKFNTLLDLIPYFPYIVAMSSNDKVILSDRSYVDEHYDELLNSGFESTVVNTYRKKLSDLTLEICKNYFLYDLENRTKIVPIGKLHKCVICEDTQTLPSVTDNDKLYDSHYYFEIDAEVDYMHDVEYVFKDGNVKVHWSDPVGFNNAIRLSTADVEYYLKDEIENGNLMIKYVSKPKEGFPKKFE